MGDLEWTAIGGAQSDSYTPTAANDSGKLLRVVVSYDDAIGTGRSATSSASKRVDREGVVTVSPSPPVAGKSVTATLSDADGMVSNQLWKWERSLRTGTAVWTEIADATASSYTPMASADGGKLLRATVSYDDAIGTGRVAVSATTQPVDQPGMVTLTTTMPVAGEALTATLSDGDGGILNAAWQWESSPDQGTPNWSGITGAEAATYTTSASLAGKLLRAVVNYDDTTGRGRQATERYHGTLGPAWDGDFIQHASRLLGKEWWRRSPMRTVASRTRRGCGRVRRTKGIWIGLVFRVPIRLPTRHKLGMQGGC